MTYDLVIRNGLVIDGAGGEPFRADIAIEGDRIAAIGAVSGEGHEEIDAAGRIVTPGFVDIHTHYDGQAIWSERLNPSSSHGVTTVVMGNCGVGFAPCRPADHQTLIDVMEGVEDIPGIVMAEGLDWSWETFPEYLDALEARRRDIDVAAFLGHAPLRVYVMGQRGIDREPATAADLAEMRRLTREAVEAGALGVASSRIFVHRMKDGGGTSPAQTRRRKSCGGSRLAWPTRMPASSRWCSTSPVCPGARRWIASSTWPRVPAGPSRSASARPMRGRRSGRRRWR